MIDLTIEQFEKLLLLESACTIHDCGKVMPTGSKGTWRISPQENKHNTDISALYRYMAELKLVNKIDPKRGYYSDASYTIEGKTKAATLASRILAKI